MKKNLSKYIVFSVFSIAVLDCSLFNKIQKEVEKTQTPQTLTASDGSCQVIVPGNWRTQPNLNNEATIQAHNLMGKLHIIVFRESKEDFGKKADLDFFTNSVRDNFKQMAEEAVLSEPLAININGYKARQFETSGEVENTKAKYLYEIIETPKNYYQIVTWTLASRYTENKAQLSEVIDSFKEIDGGQEFNSHNSNTFNKRGISN